MKKLLLKKIRKRGISEILSYVLLIFIATSVWVFVYVWIKYSANVEPAIDCKEETSINLEKSSCAYEVSGKPMLKLSIFNSGRFNISGVIVAVGTNNKNTPVDYLIPFSKDGKTITYNAGIYYFEEQLSPGKISDAKFSDILSDGINTLDITGISIVQIQPFVQDKKVRVLCKNAVIKQEIENCKFPI
jgi:hypothetical protein